MTCHAAGKPLVLAYRKHLAAYEPVFNLCGQSDIETAKLLTGREYKPYSYFLDVTPDAGTRKLMVCALASA